MAAEDALRSTILRALCGDETAAAEFVLEYRKVGGCNCKEVPPVIEPNFFSEAAVISSTSCGGLDIASEIRVKPGILLGIIRSDERGGLFLCPPGSFFSNVGTEARLVIAPPPPPKYRNATIWAKQWRRVSLSPSRNVSSSCPGLFEVRLSDIHILRSALPSPDPGLFKSVSSIRFAGRRGLNVYGYVRCKSAILAARRSRPAFLIELGSSNVQAEVNAVYVVFSGPAAVRWWPFVEPGKCFSLGGLQVVSLPRKGNKKVLSAGGSEVVVWDRLDETSENGTATGRDGIAGRDGIRGRDMSLMLSTVAQHLPMPPVASPSTRCESGRSDVDAFKEDICYSGVISKVFEDGRFELDGALSLHLGAYGGWCAGPEAVSVCFRRGARLHLHSGKIAFRRGRPSTLFTTARSVVYLEHFGESTAAAVVSLQKIRSYRDSPWRPHWKLLSPNEIVWAEELYSSLAEKFGPWFCENSAPGPKSIPTSESQWADVLLGNPSDSGPGLVRQFMSTEGVNGRFRSSSRPDVYDEFMEPGTLGEPVALSPWGYDPFPTVFSIRNIVLAFDSVTSECRSAYCVLSPERSSNGVVGFAWASDIALSALLLGSQCCSGRECEPPSKRLAQVSGVSSGRTNVRGPASVGRKRPSFVVLSEMLPCSRVCGSNTVHLDVQVGVDVGSPGLCFVGMLDAGDDADGRLRIFDATTSVCVLAVGQIQPHLLGAIVKAPRFLMFSFTRPCGNMQRVAAFDGRDLQCVVPGPYNDYAHEAGSTPRSQYAAPRNSRGDPSRIFSQRRLSLSANPESVPSLSLAVQHDTRPVVAIFVTDFSVVSRGGGGVCPSFCIFGRLLAHKPRRTVSTWTPLGDGEVGFLELALVVSGKLGMGMRDCLSTNKVFSVTCSMLPSDGDIREWVWNGCGRFGVAGGFAGGTPLDFASSELCPPHGVLLRSEAFCHRPWVEQLSGCGAELAPASRSVSEAGMSYVEDAISSWRADPATAESQFMSRTPLSELVSDPVEHAGPSTQSKPRRVKFAGVVSSVLVSDESKKRSDPQISIQVRDPCVPVFAVEVVVDGNVYLPMCVTPGVSVELARVRLSVDRDAGRNALRKRFELGEISSIHVQNVSIESLGRTRRASLCCLRPLDVNVLVANVPDVCLWQYTCESRRMPSTSSAGYGCARVVLASEPSVKFYRRPRKSGESFCSNCGTAAFVFDGMLSVDVCDGTARSRVTLFGITNILDTLHANRQERECIVQALLECEAVEFDPLISAVPQTFYQNSLSTLLSGSAVRMLESLVRHLGQHFIAIVKPEEACEPSSPGSVTMDIVINFGYGRKVATTGLPSAYSSELECAVLIEDETWKARHCAERGHMLSSVMIERQLSSLRSGRHEAVREPVNVSS